MISRRSVLGHSLAAAPLMLGPQITNATPLPFHDAVAMLERRHGGRLGVAILDGARPHPMAYRGDERFALCSTYKFLAAAFVLDRVDRQVESLARRMVYTEADLVPYSPVTQHHTGPDGLILAEICAAAITQSDNTAGNLLFDSFGGPAALTRYLRRLGDTATRSDRREPALNAVAPGDPRDTTTPAAMLATMRATLIGPALSAAARAQLGAWLGACSTGDKRLRAGVPTTWQVGDKTGSGDRNATDDIAIIWPPQRAPILVAAYYEGAEASAEQRNAVLAKIGRLAAA